MTLAPTWNIETLEMPQASINVFCIPNFSRESKIGFREHMEFFMSNHM